MYTLAFLFFLFVGVTQGKRTAKMASLMRCEYKPKSVNQQQYAEYLDASHDLIVTAIGPAGSGKTFLACINAIQKLKQGTIQKIVITRPAVSVDEDLGFLPGNLDKKMLPWTRPMFDAFSRVYSKPELIQLLSTDKIEICPLCFMRGRTFDDAFIIADEMQNSTPNQMLMLLTRIGRNSKMVVNGDLEQSDRINDNGLKDLVSKLRRKNKDNRIPIYLIEMNDGDIQRSPLVNNVLQMYHTPAESKTKSYVMIKHGKNNDSALMPLSDYSTIKKYFVNYL